ncbi:MAG: MarR family winged helix-turn-helix transcriptional regulator [Bacillota bacterium]
MDRVAGLLGFQLSQVVRKLQKTYDAAFAPYGISPSQALVLDQLWEEDGLPLKELGGRVHLDPTSVQWLVGQLEKAGLAQRHRDPQNGRIVRLWLTREGRALQEPVGREVERLRLSLHGVLIRFLTPHEIEVMERGAGILVDQLPEGEDLLAAVEAEWERRMERFRRLVEEGEGDGG